MKQLELGPDDPPAEIDFHGRGRSPPLQTVFVGTGTAPVPTNRFSLVPKTHFHSSGRPKLDLASTSTDLGYPMLDLVVPHSLGQNRSLGLVLPHRCTWSAPLSRRM